MTFVPSASQAKVLEFEGTRLLVDGPPGCGKTTIAAVKAAQVVENLLPNQQVLFLTFTNNATDRIAEALKEHLSGNQRRRVALMNYHSLFFRMVTAWGRWTGLPHQVELMSQREHAELYEEVLATVSADVGVSRRTLSENKFYLERALAVVGGYAGEVSGKTKNVFERAASLYQQVHDDGRIHFDDFEFYGLRVLDSAAIRAAYARHYPAVFVDEFQDINDFQYQAVMSIAAPGRLFAFGDSSQTIYIFAGASPTRLVDFEESKKATRITLEGSNRFSPTSDIGKMADALRAMATSDPDDWADIALAGGDVRLVPCKARPHQYGYAAKMFPSLNPTASRIGVFVSMNAEVRELSSLLTANNVRHQVLLDAEDQSLWEDVFVSAIVAPTDLDRFSRVLDHAVGSRQYRGAGKEDELERMVERSDAPRIEQVRRLAETLSSVAGADTDAVASARDSVERLVRQSERQGVVAAERIQELLRERRLRDAFRGRGQSAVGVTLMTMHKAKGKEFDTAVFFAPAGDARFMGGRDLEDAARRNEELMAWHTTVSRPRSKLIVFYTETSVSPYLAPFLD